MEWYDVLMGVLGGLGTIGGVGSIVSLYKIKPQRRAIEIENLEKALNAELERSSKLEQRSDEYKRQADEMIAKLRDRIELVERRSKIYYNSIMAAYRCRHVSDIKDCPVIIMEHELCEKNEGICKINQ